MRSQVDGHPQSAPPASSPTNALSRRQFGARCAQGVGAAASLAVPRALSGAAQAAASAQRGGPFDLAGVYFHDGFDCEPRSIAPRYWEHADWARQVEWLKACGLDAIEFATMLEDNRIPSTEPERRRITDRQRILELAHRGGLQFGYILTNTVVSTVPAGEPPGHQLQNRAVQLCPQHEENFERTLALQSWYVNVYREADFFEEFAADWGACHCGACDVRQYLRYVEALGTRVLERNRQARLYANTWCISYWGPAPLQTGWRSMFDREISGTRQVADAILEMDPHVHLALPCHHLYRQLAFQAYGGRAATPVFPQSADLASIVQAGRRVLAWPHFVMDDDPSRAAVWGLVHSEVRYIRAALQALRAAGIREVMGNLYLPNLQLINAYAFGRLVQDPTLEPASVLRDFAKLIAVPDDVEGLCDVLCWVENHSYWHQSLPSDAQESPVGRRLTKEAATAQVRSTRARSASEIPLPISGSEWLEHLVRSMERMIWAA